MEIKKYFFDSYAIIELLNGNPKYIKFVNEPVTITLFNLAEIYWFSINEYDEDKANEIYDKYKSSVVEVDYILKEAIKFRKEHKKNDLSYTDCIGYIYAKKNKLIFVTGDKEFENIDNVEFVK